MIYFRFWPVSLSFFNYVVSFPLTSSVRHSLIPHSCRVTTSDATIPLCNIYVLLNVPAFFGIEAVTAVKNLHMEVGQSDRNSNKVFFQKQNQPSSTLSLFVPPSFPD